MGIVERAWHFQKRIEDRTKRLGKGKFGRVIKMAKKPTSEEYSKTIQVTGIGLLLLGGVGFLIFFLMIEVPKWFSGLFP